MDGAVLASAALAFFLYCNTFTADFAYDDSRAIKTNVDLLSSTPITSLFFNDFWGTPLTHSGSHKSYRPLCVLSFRLNYEWGELDAFGYHVVNVALHTIVTALFTRLARNLLCGSSLATLVAGLLFAAHPIHSEAVAGVVGRADVGACLFFLLSFIAYMRYCRQRDNKRSRRWLSLGCAICCCTCSMLTKEHGITVLAVCATYDVLVHSRVRPRDLGYILLEKKYRGLLEGLLVLGGSLVFLLSVRIHFMGSRPPDFAPADNPASDSDSWLTRTLSFLYLPAFNLYLLLCPQLLSFDWSMEAIPLVTSLLDPRNVLSLAFYCGLGHGLVYTVRGINTSSTDHAGSTNGCIYFGRDECFKTSVITSKKKGHRVPNGVTSVHQSSNESATSPDSSTTTSVRSHVDVLVVALAVLILPFLPATNFFFYVGFVVAERVLYVPSMGFCLVVALGVQALYRTVVRKRLFLSIVGFVILVLCLRTLRRNADWQTEENLYRSGIPINPPKAYGNLANILSAQGKKEEAEWAYKKALSYRSNMADVHYNLGILLQEQKRYDEALQSYRLAIQFRPRMAMAHLNLGLVLGILSRKEEAAEVYRHCSQLDGTGLKDPRTHETTKISALFNLGRLFADDGKYEEAIAVYKEATRKMPPYYQPQSLYNMLGEAYFKLERFEQAEQWYKEALRAKPDHIPAHLTYGKMLAKQQNRAREAERWFARAKQLAPNDSSVFQHYGQFLSEVDRHVEAAEHYVRAAQLAPDEYEIVFNAANTLRQAGHNEEAEKYYHQAVRIRPNEATSHMNLGAMLHVNGKLLEAESSYLEALRLKPEDAITHNNLQKLRNLLVKKGLRADTMR